MISYLDVTKHKHLFLWKSLVMNDKEKVPGMTASFQLLLSHHEGNNVHISTILFKKMIAHQAIPYWIIKYFEFHSWERMKHKIKAT